MNAQSATKPVVVVADLAPAPAATPPRKKRRLGLMLSLPMLLLGGAALYWVNGGRFEATDNANLHQARINIASDLGGRVVSVGVADGKTIAKGAVMFQVDPVPYRLALVQAEVAVNAARLQVEQLKGAYAAAVALDKVAQDEGKYQADQLTRQQALSAKGVATTSALDDMRNTARKAGEQAEVAAIAVTNAKAALGGNPEDQTDQHPAVAAAIAARDQARYRLELTEVKAPADGLVYQATSFKPGQMLAAGTAAFTLLEQGDTWVDANFKETQLTHIQAGQAATITFDVDSGHKFAGHVEAIGAGTGSEFSLLPAQNATGNWVKVNQRVPVRIRLDNPADATLIVTGMSATVSVDTGQMRSWSDLIPPILSGK